MTINSVPGVMFTKRRSAVPLLTSIVVKPVKTLSAVSSTTSKASGKRNWIASTPVRPEVLRVILRRLGFAFSLAMMITRVSDEAPPLPVTLIVAALGELIVKVSSVVPGSSTRLSVPPWGTSSTLVEMESIVVDADAPPRLNTASFCAFSVMVIGPVALPPNEMELPVCETVKVTVSMA